MTKIKRGWWIVGGWFLASLVFVCLSESGETGKTLAMLALAGALQVLGWLLWAIGVLGVAFFVGMFFGWGFRLGSK